MVGQRTSCVRRSGKLDLLTRVVAQFEGFRPDPYPDAVGKLTVGYGHLIKDGELFPAPLTKEDALAILAKDLLETRRGVDALFRDIFLTYYELAALTSFAFNVGVGALEKSTLRRRVLSRNGVAAAHEFTRWVWATGKDGTRVRLPGLVKRRDVESVWFLGAHSNTLCRMVGLDTEDE